MDARPSLVLQMQRLGDIVLAFPLFLWRARLAPESPLWVVAEPGFYQALLKVSPRVLYIPWTEAGRLEGREYRLVVNLSHRPEAAELAGRLKATFKLGPLVGRDGALRVSGTWPLYRASLTHNNRHNRYHWSELNALGCVDSGCFRHTHLDPPRDQPGDGVGLFVGASQDEKRPTPEFYAALAAELLRRGLKPALFGGPGDTAFGARVAELAGGRVADFCGRFGLEEFMAVGQTLSLLVTPDTGPMHLAAWSGLKVLNLSMGPVSPWETGPYPPGHYVLRASLSCLDCWRCRFGEPRCRGRFDPAAVAFLAQRLARPEGTARLKAPPGMRLYRTGRTVEGMYRLERLGTGGGSASELVGEFWRGAFGLFFGLFDRERPRSAYAALAVRHPALAGAFVRSLTGLGRRLRAAEDSPRPPADDSFWRQTAPMVRPLAGYMHMLLQNGDFSLGAWRTCHDLLDLTVGVLG